MYGPAFAASFEKKVGFSSRPKVEAPPAQLSLESIYEHYSTYDFRLSATVASSQSVDIYTYGPISDQSI